MNASSGLALATGFSGEIGRNDDDSGDFSGPANRRCQARRRGQNPLPVSSPVFPAPSLRVWSSRPPGSPSCPSSRSATSTSAATAPRSSTVSSATSRLPADRPPRPPRAALFNRRSQLRHWPNRLPHSVGRFSCCERVGAARIARQGSPQMRDPRRALASAAQMAKSRCG